MPVTTRAAPVVVKAAPEPLTFDSISLLRAVCPSLCSKPGTIILNTSFGDDAIPIGAGNRHGIAENSNGFVATVLDAYIQHNHLVLRPEDVWLAVLIQFSFYVNKHAEELRTYFVDHGGKRRLKVVQGRIDLPALVLEMTELIAKNVKDPSLREWATPNFSTTTEADRITAAIVMLGTMQKYFAYSAEIICGIPSVTLLGERKDWEDILERVGYLAKFGGEHPELLLWNSALTAVVSHFVETFEHPDAPDVVTFWQKTVHQYNHHYYGEKYITGWILAFCFWTPEGEPLVAQNIKSSAKDWEKGVADTGPDWWLEDKRMGDLGWDRLPAGYAHVPIHIKDSTTGDKWVANAIAGFAGWRILDSDALFAVTRGSGAIVPEKSKQALLNVSKKSKASGPSMLTGATLVERNSTKKPGFLKSIAQVFCFRSEDSIDDNASQVEHDKPTEGSEMTDDNLVQTFGPPRDNGDMEDGLAATQYEVGKSDPSVPHSDLGELEKPWKYERGGTSDTIQAMSGWWIVRTVDGVYGKDPDVPDAQFDSDAEDCDGETGEERAATEGWATNMCGRSFRSKLACC